MLFFSELGSTLSSRCYRMVKESAPPTVISHHTEDVWECLQSHRLPETSIFHSKKLCSPKWEPPFNSFLCGQLCFSNISSNVIRGPIPGTPWHPLQPSAQGPSHTTPTTPGHTHSSCCIAICSLRSPHQMVISLNTGLLFYCYIHVALCHNKVCNYRIVKTHRKY